MNDETITLYTSDGVPVEIDFSTLEENQQQLILLNETNIQNNETIIHLLESQIAIEKEINQFCGFCFVMLIVFFLYRIFHSVMSF